MRRTATLLVATAVVATLTGGCGGGAAKDGDHEGEHELKAADTTTCRADATAVDASAYPAAFPAAFPFPGRTVVYDVEDRGQDGVIATGVTDEPFKQVLADFNGPAQDAGFTVTNGETEEHDAEANWTGNGHHGRWAIRVSGTCPGETVVQVLAAKG
ncbi:MAG: hypothetical protein ACTHNS_01425 [Marmoricola sp.]